MPSSAFPRRSDISLAVLIIGAVVYALLCVPAIGRRGYPPIDPVWLAVTHLWVVPVCLSGLFDSYTFRSRRIHLVVFSLITAFFNAGTLHFVTPRFVSPALMVVGTIFPYGPFHVATAFAIEAIMQLVLGRSRSLIDDPNASRGVPRVSLFTWIVGYSVICIGIGFPFVYRSLKFNDERARGSALADEHWASDEVVLFGDDDSFRHGDAHVEYHADRDTGLPRRFRTADLGFRDAYNARIAELIDQNGLPGYSVKNVIATPDQLVALLDATDLTEVISFPYEATPNLVLMRRGSISRWGSISSSSSDSLTIVSKKNGTLGVGDAVNPVYVKRQNQLVSIRNGTRWVGVFHEDGTMIASVWRW